MGQTLVPTHSRRKLCQRSQNSIPSTKHPNPQAIVSITTTAGVALARTFHPMNVVRGPAATASAKSAKTSIARDGEKMISSPAYGGGADPGPGPGGSGRSARATSTSPAGGEVETSTRFGELHDAHRTAPVCFRQRSPPQLEQLTVYELQCTAQAPPRSRQKI